jgi:dTDP-4-amino-4,6-dideoxygalactose transaminase
MTTGEGGMVTTNDPVIADNVRFLRNHGQKERYKHHTLGYNLRMTELQGALGLVQVEKLPRLTEQRTAHATFLTEQLYGVVETPVTRPGCYHVFNQYIIRVSNKRDEWVNGLNERGIGTAVHYPTPIYKQPFYRQNHTKYRIISDSSTVGDAPLPVTETAARQVLSLPVHPALSKEDLATVAREVLRLCN